MLKKTFCHTLGISQDTENKLWANGINSWEEFLDNYQGCILVVSHDRWFMNKLVEHIFVFEGEGKITDFPGNYTIYRNKIEEEQAIAKEKNSVQTGEKKKTATPKPVDALKKKLSFNEKLYIKVIIFIYFIIIFNQ